MAETFWAAARLDVPVAWADVTIAGDEAEVDGAGVSGKSFTTALLPGVNLTVVVNTGELFTVFDITSVAAVSVVVVAGTNVRTALTATGDEDAVDGVVAAGVATVVVLAES